MVTVPAKVATAAKPALFAYVALATAPVTFDPLIFVRFAPLPIKKFALAALPKFALLLTMLPDTFKLVKVPTLVMLGCAFAVTVTAVVDEPALKFVS